MTFFFKLQRFFLPLFLVFMIMIGFATSVYISGFTYNGFKDYNLLNRDGIADITYDGLLRLTNFNNKQEMGYAFYSDQIKFKNPPPADHGNTSTANNKVFSFFTTFVFKIIPYGPDSRGQGIAFFIAPQRGLPGAQPSQYLGLFNMSSTGDPANHVLAVELDTNMNSEYDDINSNHVGIDINSISSTISKTAGYFTKSSGGDFKNLDLVNQKLQVWVEYDGGKKQLDVTLAPFMVPKPNTPLLSLPIDLSPIILDYMYVGFSASVGNYKVSSYIFGWSFKINGQAQELNLSQLPDLPGPNWKIHPVVMTILIILSVLVVLIVIYISVLLIIWKKKHFFMCPRCTKWMWF